ncbi:hypothetical protein GC163_24230 [bacterium]|nr:hypothetical protein [bacterium]
MNPVLIDSECLQRQGTRLLPLTAFEEIFEPTRGKRIGYVRLPGNVGDLLIEETTLDLAAAYGCCWQLVDLNNGLDCDELVIAGGGNMGPLWRECHAIRQQALSTGLPVTILPQSYIEPEIGDFHRLFIREQASRQHAPMATLAPDLALGAYRWCSPTPTHSVGVWLRGDRHGLFQGWPSYGDPIRQARTVREYLALAASFEHIITDRLHMAIASLLCGREITLLPLCYHKNQSMYETWLCDLGCHWATSPEEALAQLHSQ